MDEALRLFAAKMDEREAKRQAAIRREEHEAARRADLADMLDRRRAAWDRAYAARRVRQRSLALEAQQERAGLVFDIIG
jgi:hypothetical protein